MQKDFLANKTAFLWLAVLMVFGIPGAVVSQEIWSLESCIRYALENNIQIKQQKLGVDVARENLLQSKVDRLPSLNGGASHGYNFGRTIDPFTNEFATERVRSNNFSMSSGVTLFSGFQIHKTIRQRELELEASVQDVATMENDISLAVASAYLQVLFSMELAAIASNQLEITQQQVQRTTQLVDAGTLARGSLYLVQAQAASEELTLVNARNQLDIAYLTLAQLLDLPSADDFLIAIPEITIEGAETVEFSPLHVYDTAVQTQPQIRASDIRVQSAETSLEIARGARSPVISMRGSYGTGYSGASLELVETSTGMETRVKPFRDQLNDNLNRSIGMSLTIPIFNGLQVKTAIGRSKIALDNAILGNQLVRNELYKTIQQAHADAQAALKKYVATETNVAALEESFRYTEQRFNVGMVNSLEYNDAKNRLTAAQSELLQSKYEYVFRTKVLDFYMGNPITL